MEIDKILQKIKDFELINNGVGEAFIDVSNVKVMSEGILCTITIYDVDISSKAICNEVVYPRSLIQNI